MEHNLLTTKFTDNNGLIGIYNSPYQYIFLQKVIEFLSGLNQVNYQAILEHSLCSQKKFLPLFKTMI